LNDGAHRFVIWLKARLQTMGSSCLSELGGPALLARYPHWRGWVVLAASLAQPGRLELQRAVSLLPRSI